MKKTICCFFLYIPFFFLHAQTIIGGTNAPSGAYPWTAAIADASKTAIEEAHLCGGSLIADHWVLTAAHCISDAQALGISELDVVVGITDLENPAPGFERIRVAEKYIHPGFGLIGNRNFDLALLRLEVPSAKPVVRLPAQNDQSYYQAGTAAKVLGWGLADTLTYESSTLLQEADIEVIDLNFCNGQTVYEGEITLDMFCAGTLPGAPVAGSATGDSGGPLVVWDGNSWLQIGIVSWGKLLWSNANFPGVFQKTAIHRSWIEETIAGNSVSTVYLPTAWQKMTVYEDGRDLVIDFKRLKADKEMKLFLTDLLGRKLIEKRIPASASSVFKISWDQLPGGIYVLSLLLDGSASGWVVVKHR